MFEEFEYKQTCSKREEKIRHFSLGTKGIMGQEGGGGK